MKTDVGWKFILDELTQQFIEFFMPDLYNFVDFSIKPKALDNEFASLFPESVSEDRRVDKLFEIYLKNGQTKWILLNIEIQSYDDSDFAKRMFQHYFRIFDKFNRELEAIVIYTYKPDRHKYKKYESKFLETKITYEFRTYDIAEQSLDELEKIKNPFSFVVQTLIKGFDYKETDKNNFNFKKELSSLLFDSGYSEDEVRKVFKFLNFILEIKDRKLRENFYSEVIKMSTVKDYKLELTDFEQVALEKRDKELELKRSKEIAKNFKNKGFDLRDISEATGLSIEEIEKL
ncbi:MAG: Rpn family recombination-promoting nuclease/putative transposase [Candidatus Sericytochromatia bacterium]|nr:Rpn family recombination-promoting nuclease/putative transposase [Candidatus Sericytochromatia bacterium]